MAILKFILPEKLLFLGGVVNNRLNSLVFLLLELEVFFKAFDLDLEIFYLLSFVLSFLIEVLHVGGEGNFVISVLVNDSMEGKILESWNYWKIKGLSARWKPIFKNSSLTLFLDLIIETALKVWLMPKMGTDNRALMCLKYILTV